MREPARSQEFVLACRDNDNTWRLWYSRRQRNISKMDAQGV
jgi:hypothetical protein